MKLIIDTHLDLAWNALTWKRDLTLPLAEINAAEAGMSDEIGRGRSTTCFPELRRAGVAVCLGTLMARVPYATGPAAHAAKLDYPCHDAAYAVAQGQLAYYRRLAERGEVSLIRTAGELDKHWQLWHDADETKATQLPVGIIIAMEGCDAIVDPQQAERWFEDGLRCPSLVHYGRSAYATGTGEEGPLTAAGREMLDQFRRVGMILDVTHLCDTSFFEALELFDGPVMASHQNCRTLVPGGRQFSNEQIELVIQRDGILGTALDAWMLYPGWVRGKTLASTTSRDVVGLEAAIDHVDHVCQLAGNCRHAAIGSDLDGGFGSEQTPRDLDTIADLQKLVAMLSARGYQDDDINSIFHGNWLRFFRSHLPQ